MLAARCQKHTRGASGKNGLLVKAVECDCQSSKTVDTPLVEITSCPLIRPQQMRMPGVPGVMQEVLEQCLTLIELIVFQLV